MILVLDPNPESELHPFGDSGSGFVSSVKWSHNISRRFKHGEGRYIFTAL